MILSVSFLRKITDCKTSISPRQDPAPVIAEIASLTVPGHLGL